MPDEIPNKGFIPLTVNRDVVKYLSIGIYQNFGRAIKEVISNAYDAQATEVRIRLDLIGNRVIIRDNGIGMDYNDLKNRYFSVANPTPLTEEYDDLHRKRVGKFGIGAVAIFPYCDKITIITKKRKSDIQFQVEIDTSRFFKGNTFKISESEAQFPYISSKSDLPFIDGETIILLDKLKPQIIDILRKEKSLMGNTIEKWSGFERFKWTLCQYCPLLFPENQPELKKFFEDKEKVPLRLWLDNEELFRNVPEGAKILEKDEKQFGSIKIKYAILTPYGPVKPGEAKGIQLRLRDVAIGLPRDFNIINLTSKIPGKLNYLCGEIHILEGLSDALMIDRDNFFYTEDVAKLEAYFRKKLVYWNEKLEDDSLQDKQIYESLMDIGGSEDIIKELNSANIVKFSKERFRLTPGAISKSKRRQEEQHSPISVMKSVLKDEKGYSVETSINDVDKASSPIKIDQQAKKIIIYENHPAFAEKIFLFDLEFDVINSEHTSFSSICQLLSDKKVVFNLSHPLFSSGLNERIVKRLGLGLMLLLKNEKNSEKLLHQMERLLLEIFVRE